MTSQSGTIRAVPASPLSRRRFLGASALLPGIAASAAGEGRQRPPSAAIAGKTDLRVLSDRPVNAETWVTDLDPRYTPNDRHFVRNNGGIPERALAGDLDGWTLKVDGEVEAELELSFDDLATAFETVSLSLVLECAGNGRAAFRPAAAGNPWWLGAVGCARYAGVRLRDVLESAGLRSSAVYVAWYGEDPPLGGGDADAVPISRGIPVSKALDPDTILAFEMNGEPLPPIHGFPLRLVAPGYPASASGKWLRRLWIRDRVHDGPKMTGHSYRMPREPVAPGTEVPEADMRIIETMPVKSIITAPASGVRRSVVGSLALRGHAWSGAGRVAAMHLSADFGATWVDCRLEAPENRFAWQRWEGRLVFDIPGHYEVWARATDDSGRMQPMVTPGWNPRGYLNNAMHRIAVTVI